MAVLKNFPYEEAITDAIPIPSASTRPEFEFALIFSNCVLVNRAS